jgi:hypothetical protein
MSIMTSMEGAIDQAENWVEKEAGLIEHQVTSTKIYHSAEHIGASIDKWFEGVASSVDTETARYYSEAATLIKGLFK